MSGFGAAIDLTGSPRAAGVDRMSLWLERRGRDGVDTWRGEGAALAHAHFWTTREEVGERQPLVSPCGRHVLAGHIRVDNRAELISQLPAGAVTGTASDAHFVLEAYRHWGEGCARRLVGDFAFAIWDRRARSLYCARDPMGVRTLVYHAGNGRLVVGSETGVVLSGLEQRPPENRALLEDMLAHQWERYVHETAYRGVLRLPPGYQLHFSEQGLRLERYWKPSIQQPSRPGDDREYLERFRELFLQSVGDRLRAPGPVGLSISGGMDSSSVAGAAEHHVAAGHLGGAAQARLYTSVYERTPAAEERAYFDAVARHCEHLPARRLATDHCWALSEFGADHGHPLDDPEVGVNRSMLIRVARSAAEDGCRVMMGGFGGDQALCGEPYFSPRLLGDVPWRRTLEELPHFRRCSLRPTWWLLGAAYGLPHVPEQARKLLERKLRRREWGQSLLPLREPSGEPLALPNALYPPQLPTQAAKEIHRNTSSGLFLAEMLDLNTAWLEAGVEARHPFLDQRLVEFLFATPSRVLFQRGVFKRPLRLALADLLPTEVRERVGRAHFSELVDRGLRVEALDRRRSLLDDPLIVAEGLVDPQRLRAAWDRWERNPDSFCTRPLFAPLLIEAWLRHHRCHREEKQAVAANDATGPVV
ncbi:MAG: asparagine synthetase B family protein [Actinomycetota bacterium]